MDALFIFTDIEALLKQIPMIKALADDKRLILKSQELNLAELHLSRNILRKITEYYVSEDCTQQKILLNCHQRALRTASKTFPVVSFMESRQFHFVLWTDNKTFSVLAFMECYQFHPALWNTIDIKSSKSKTCVV